VQTISFALKNDCRFFQIADEGFVESGRRIMRILTVFVTMSAWFAISNHCALGTAAPEAKPAPNECPFHAKQSAPAKQKQSSDSPCCKILRATLSISPKNFPVVIVDLGAVSFAKLVVLAPPKIVFGHATVDTGPPGTTSFVELIGSMRAHAPPWFA
jgi:hypothetical protein